jgi:UDP-N-acetylglucosamine acyltransferase
MAANPVRIHPTAIVDPAAVFGEGTVIDAFAIVEGSVRLGPGCTVRSRAHLIGEIVAGPGNDFGIGCVVGDRAQHLALQHSPGRIEIGEFNVFRENVTIHRGTPEGSGTRVGSHNFLMVNTHIAHDCRVGDHCIFANGAVIGGHAVIEDRVFLSGNTGVHQQCRIGRLAMVSATSSATKDVPPFGIAEGRNRIIGVNLVGLKRAGMTTLQIDGIRRAYRILLTSGLLLSTSVQRIERELGHIDAVLELVKFIRAAGRGICLTRARRHRKDEA